jgi:histidinol-phosphatase
MENLDEFIRFSKQLSDLSGEIIKKYFRTNLSIETKEDRSPVTIADKNAEVKMREAIMKEFPDHGIIGEEFGNYNEAAEYKWVLDPIDGTKSFICGSVIFGTLIALTKNDFPILGVINQPVLNEFLVGDNQTSRLNGNEVKMRECPDISNAVLLTSDHLTIEEYRDINKFYNLMRKVRIYRAWGDCYGYYLLATGFADIMVDPIMSVWDTMALVPIINGAGGIITDYYGNDPLRGNSIIASHPRIHSEIIKLLS